jgi:hypothetical protein
MQHDADAQENRATAVATEASPQSRWRVSFVEALPAYRLRVRFVDGLEGTVEMATFLSGGGAGVFSALLDEALFRQVRNEMGVVTWPNELDLAPDAMHHAIAKTGCWVLGQSEEDV